MKISRRSSLNWLGGFLAVFAVVSLVAAAYRVRQLINAQLVALWTDQNGDYSDATAGMMTQQEVQKTLGRGADISATDRHGETVLIAATRSDHADIVQWLLAHGADMNAIPIRRRHPHHFVLKDLIQIVQRKPVDDFDYGHTDEQTALMDAAEDNDRQIVHLLLSHGAPVDARDSRGITALMLAAREGSSDLIHCLLTSRADVNAKSNDGYTPLILAAGYGNLAMIKLLLSKGADVNASTRDGETALTGAANIDNVAAVKLLLAHGAKVNTKNRDGVTALMWEAGPGGEYARTFLPSHGADYSGPIDPYERMTVCPVCQAEIIDLMLTHGADIHARDNRGETALVWALSNPAAEKVLLAHGVDINGKDNEGQTALSQAIAAHMTADIILLKAAGAK